MVTTEVRQGQLAENRDERWQAVAARDGARDGEFVTAVITTGIYCRPSCPARLPHYRNVVFFPVPEVAEEAGFRPCKRCSPHLQPVEDPQLQIVRGVCREIEGASEFRPTLAQLGERLGINPPPSSEDLQAHRGDFAARVCRRAQARNAQRSAQGRMDGDRRPLRR